MDKSNNVASLVNELNNIVNELKSLIPTQSIPLNLSDMFELFEMSHVNFNGALNSFRITRAAHFAGQLSAHSAAIYTALSGITTPAPTHTLQRLKAKAEELKASVDFFAIEQWPEKPSDKLYAFDPDLSDLQPLEESHYYKVRENLKSLSDEQEKHDQRVKKLLNENEIRISGLEQKLKELEGVAQVEIEKITSTYLASLNEVEVKKTEIDDILGHVSGRAVAGDYEKSAAEERKMADWLRAGSLVCMGAIAIVLGYSFIETIDTDFNWQKSLFRIALAFLLSVPAAYLARESAKHREQQYQHLQTSLDLKAISPFMASLPEDEQHKIKIAIASKIFAGRDFSKVSADPYPLNTHEIIIELIKRFDPAKANSKPTNDAA